MSEHGRLWAIILAAGEGRRLAPLTERLYGEALPKQFAVLAKNRSLLQATVERLLPLVPPSRMVVVVPVAYEALAREQLEAFPGAHVVAQPANRGTGPGILLPLAHVLEADPRARVVVAPSDHDIGAPARFNAAIATATERTATMPLILVGAEADHPETEYGWIEPGESLGGGLRRAAGFVEKPCASRARDLYARGFLWNTFTMVAGASRLWRMAEERMPVQAALIRACVASAGAKGPCLARVYDQIEEANFSRAVLEHAAELGVVCARGCGFSDWGSPERVLESLRGTTDLDRLLERIAARGSNSRAGRPPAASLIVRDRAMRTPDGAERQEGTPP